MKHPRYRIVLEIVSRPDGVPPIVRLRAALKTLWRAYGFRNQGIVPDLPADDAERPPALAQDERKGTDSTRNPSGGSMR